ncbi:S-adenosyl-L-methionine-dependent methyltransferase [Mycena belliarum]|uniref:Protein-lysine N-methyltransferase EFM4 n=1 Tax=Mycena belliarum TaxID=1033014 RepID=A0AAD6XY32_9AGAR|nr:S-adenosyl-L-methionine-dependent methyltransferase [Mycena belliae]
MSVSDLQPSKLGRKEHWDQVYETELENFNEHGDEGEIWFGVQSVEKMVNWALQHVPPSQNASTLEVGSGNGTLLFALVEAGYDTSCLCGIDYSADAVKLAHAIAETTEGGDSIMFAECDFLASDPPCLPNMPPSQRPDVWDLILDKGTFDAIALAEKDADGKSPAAHYPGRVARLLKPGGYFLITSCNFTEDELRTNFETTATGLKYHSRIQHKTYTFGGKSGSPCSSVAFINHR